MRQCDNSDLSNIVALTHYHIKTSDIPHPLYANEADAYR